MNNQLVVTWKNSKNSTWCAVGLLTFKEGKYFFNYTNGAKAKNFVPFSKMDNLTKTYVSDDLFPIFKNRLLAKSRPEYNDFLEWLDIDKSLHSEFLELSRSRGIRATDSLQLFPMPKKNEVGEYEVLFFSHGIKHIIAENYIARLSKLQAGDELLLLKDFQNSVDPYALALRTKDKPIELLGYCPSFFGKEFHKLIALNGEKNVRVFVQKINHIAPLQLKLLCRLTTAWHKDFHAFEGDEFKLYQ